MSQRDDALIMYRQVCATGHQRGVYQRIARRLGVSDETVRRWVRDAEQEADVDLEYVPPPGGYPDPMPAYRAVNMPHEPENATETPHDATDELEPPVQENATPQPADATYHTFERAVAYSRLDPGWDQPLSWLYAHMDVVQLVVGIVIVWLLTGLVR